MPHKIWRNAILILLFLCAAAYVYADSSDTLTISTYYPSPYGMYNEMRANKMVVGDLSLTTTPSPANGQLYVTRSVVYKPLDPLALSNASRGEVVYNSTTSKLNYYDGGWKDIGGELGNYQIGCAYTPGAFACCRMSSTDGSATCRYTTDFNGTWNNVSDTLWTSGTAGNYRISCGYVKGAFACCKMEINNGSAVCRYITDFNGTWNNVPDTLW